MKNLFFTIVCLYSFTEIATAGSIPIARVDDERVHTFVDEEVELIESEIDNKVHYIFSITDTPGSCLTQTLGDTVEQGTVPFTPYPSPNSLVIAAKKSKSSCISNSQNKHSVDLGALSAGTYTLAIVTATGRVPIIDGLYSFKILSPLPAFHETPSTGLYSGVATIRGWVCDAQKVEIAIDDEPRLRIPYKGDRGDTKEVCGDTDNGYSMAINWGRYTTRQHFYTVYADDIQIDSGAFSVIRLNQDKEFLEGLEAEYTLSDFPAEGQSAIIRWSEADQNFIINGVRNF